MIEATRYIDRRLRTLKNLLVSINLFQDFWISDIYKWSIISFIRRYHDLCFAIRFRIEIRECFHLFYSVFVLITNEHRMHVQKFAKENVFSSYEMTRYFRIFYVLIIFSHRNSNANLLRNFSNAKSNSLQKFFSSFSSISFQISVSFHDCRVRYEFNAFTNKSSRLRILSIDERKNNELSFRDEIERKRKIMWRACIEFNIWQN